MQLSERIQMLRKKQGMSQEAMAEQLHVSRQAVSKWELGVSIPDVDKIILISDLFGVTTDFLLKGIEKPSQTEQKVIYINEIKEWKFEKKSKKTIFGLPLYHIHFERVSRCGGLRIGFGGNAKGIVAIGGKAKGVLAIGFLSRGVLSVGLLSVGMISLGLVSAGVLAFGCLAAGLVAGGNIGVGVLAFGNAAIGIYALGNVACGNKIALGNYANGHIAIGNTVSGIKEVLLQDRNFSDMDRIQVRKLILEEFPKTWKWIIKLFTMW